MLLCKEISTDVTLILYLTSASLSSVIFPVKTMFLLIIFRFFFMFLSLYLCLHPLIIISAGFYFISLHVPISVLCFYKCNIFITGFLMPWFMGSQNYLCIFLPIIFLSGIPSFLPICLKHLYAPYVSTGLIAALYIFYF